MVKKTGNCLTFFLNTSSRKKLEICNVNEVLAINPLGPIVHGLYFSRDVFSIRCIFVTLSAEPSSFFLSEKEKEEALP